MGGLAGCLAYGGVHCVQCVWVWLDLVDLQLTVSLSGCLQGGEIVCVRGGRVRPLMVGQPTPSLTECHIPVCVSVCVWGIAVHRPAMLSSVCGVVCRVPSVRRVCMSGGGGNGQQVARNKHFTSISADLMDDGHLNE